jgi:putative tricarboxylic transport membrane protein
MIRSTALAAFAALALTAAPTGAQPRYPVQNVTIITHGSPGGSADTFIREVAKHMEKRLGATIVVENVRAGSGAAAMTRVATAAPDGSTIAALFPAFVYTSLLSKPRHVYTDLEPIANMVFDPQIVYARADARHADFKGIVDAARVPGANPKWGAPNAGSLERLLMERFRRVSRATATIVPHDGDAGLLLAVLNGTVEFGVGEVGLVRGHVEGGRLRILASFTQERMQSLPQVPTVRELGFDVIANKFRAIGGPKGMPRTVVAAWENGIQDLLKDPEFVRWMRGHAIEPGFIPAERMGAFLTEWSRNEAALLRELAILRD